MAFRLTLGANYKGEGRSEFRVWAPDRRSVDLALETRTGVRFLPLEARPDGWFEGTHPAEPGARYRYRLDGQATFPDPCARFLPDGPEGPAQVVDPNVFEWTDAGFPGLSLEGCVILEAHVGTFTQEGTYAAAERRLPELAELGITCLELMPLATFPGRFNWGYDGVGLFAPCAVYGTPDELRHLIDSAHRHGIGVILDVVYNHLGPSGNVLGQFAKRYFTDRHPSEWGTPFDLDGQDSAQVRDLLIQNACHWIAEYHFDGFRLDATQNVYDDSPTHLLAELSERTREVAAPRKLLLIAESEPQDTRLVRPRSEGGFGLDALWVDDFHHSAKVAYSGNREAYCQDYRGTAQELLSCVLRNGLYQGQWYAWQKKRRGGPLWAEEPRRAVFFLQNHDQIANTLRGFRMDRLAGPSRTRALTTFFLLLPQTPMLFMGQPFFARSPFLYFSDHRPDLQKEVDRGREKFLAQFESAEEAMRVERFHPPTSEAAFRLSKLNLEDRREHDETWSLHKALLTLRRTDPCFAAQNLGDISGAVLSESALVLRWVGDARRGDRLLLLNLGTELRFDPCPEPLLAPRPGSPWRPSLSSEETRFGGTGAVIPDGMGPWWIPGQCALVLTSTENS